MKYFMNPLEFEDALVKTADSLLWGNAEIWHHPMIGGEAEVAELDYVFKPKTYSPGDALYIFEFKYSSSPTLADSTIYTQFARFSALRMANPMQQLRFVLVTNGRTPATINKPAEVLIFDEIYSAEVWRNKLESWLRSEIPNFRTH